MVERDRKRILERESVCVCVCVEERRKTPFCRKKESGKGEESTNKLKGLQRWWFESVSQWWWVVD